MDCERSGPKTHPVRLKFDNTRKNVRMATLPYMYVCVRDKYNFHIRTPIRLSKYAKSHALHAPTKYYHTGKIGTMCVNIPIIYVC